LGGPTKKRGPTQGTLEKIKQGANGWVTIFEDRPTRQATEERLGKKKNGPGGKAHEKMSKETI